jgi:heptosyltransferase-2
MKKIENIKKILVINLGGIGDVLLSTPALRGLKACFPDARISLLAVPRVMELAKDLPYIDEVFVLDMKFASIIKEPFLLFKLRSRRFDLAINMRTLVTDRSARKIRFLFNMIGPRIKAGRDTDGRGDFLDIKIPEAVIGQKPEMEYDIDTVKALGADPKDRTIDFHIAKVDLDKISVLLEDRGIRPEDRLIGIHPGGRPSHRWPLANFAKVIEELRKKTACKFVITGDKSEKGLAAKLAHLSGGHAIDAAGELTIKELGALIKKCDVFISNDTAPIHIAAILKTPIIALFGPGDIIRFDPKNISDKAITLKCLGAIAPAEVVDATLHFVKH